MKASEIMTTDVVTVGPETPVKDIAVLMTKHRISGVPVVDADGNLVGILSESDLLHRTETGTERQRKWWLGMFQDSNTLAREFTKSHGLKAADIMTKSVTTIEGSAELGQVAELLEKKKLKRVPVVSGGKLAGIVTRGDLVRAFAQAADAPKPAMESDAEISKVIGEKIRDMPWLRESYVSVLVNNGIAEVNGMVPTEEQRQALKVLVEEVPGVKGVAEHIKVGPINLST